MDSASGNDSPGVAAAPDNDVKPPAQRAISSPSVQDSDPESESEDNSAWLVSGAVRGQPPAKRRKCSQVFSLEKLQAELEALRREPPAYVSGIGHLNLPALIGDKGGLLKPKASEGPWDLVVSVRGPEEDEAYGIPFRVRLRFDPDLWPQHLAMVRFQCVLHHGFTDDDGGMLMPFYSALPRDDSGACTLRLMLQATHDFLVDPLAAFRIEKPPPKAVRMLEFHRNMNRKRLKVIREYATMVKNPELFPNPAKWSDEWFDPLFLNAVRTNTPDAWRAILTDNLPGEVFSFKIFTEAFCDTLVSEIHNFYSSGLEARRPNSMNNYGIILNEIGLEPMIDELQRILQPLGALCFPGAGSAWDGNHCFIVRYRAGEDLGLDMHTDDSDVTVNICLGVDFAGAGLQFCGVMGAPNHRKTSFKYDHVKGSAVFHLGRKRHGADDISRGERLNLILWNHGSAYRQSDEYTQPPYESEEAPPDAVCVSYTHDRDFGNYKDYPVGKEEFKGQGWCPRTSHEYPGFKPDCDVEEPLGF